MPLACLKPHKENPLNQRREKMIERAFASARREHEGDPQALCSHLLHVLDGTLGDTQALCWGAIRQLDRYYEPRTFSTPRDHGLHFVDQHLLFTVANDAVSHLDVVERLLREISDSCEECDMGSQLSALSEACPEGFRVRLRETRNLLYAHRDERVLHWRLAGEHTERVKEAYGRLGIEVPRGTIDTQIVAYSRPPGASAQEAAEGRARVGQIGGGIAHLAEIQKCMEKMEEALGSVRDSFFSQ